MCEREGNERKAKEMKKEGEHSKEMEKKRQQRNGKGNQRDEWIGIEEMKGQKMGGWVHKKEGKE